MAAPANAWRALGDRVIERTRSDGRTFVIEPRGFGLTSIYWIAEVRDGDRHGLATRLNLPDAKKVADGHGR